MSDSLHTHLLFEIENHSSPSKQGEQYFGTPHKFKNLKAANRKKIAKAFKTNNPLSQVEYEDLLHELYVSDLHQAKLMAGELLKVYPQYRKQLNLKKLNTWLGFLSGWAEVDGTCQSSFTAKELLERWDEWRTLLESLNQDKNINKRRASLVLLVRAVRDSTDQRFTKLALENIDTLKSEKDILITKAISWLLREMVKRHKQLVVSYLQDNQDSLPAIVLRETWRKVRTGRKSLR